MANGVWDVYEFDNFIGNVPSFKMIWSPSDLGHMSDGVAGDAGRFFHDVVFAGKVAVVGRVDDDGVFGEARFAQVVEHNAD